MPGQVHRFDEVPVHLAVCVELGALHVGVETVRTHARHIYRKLGVSTRRELRPPI